MSGQPYLYNRPPCAKQTLDNQQYFSYNMPLNNYQMDNYNMQPSKNQSLCMYSDWPDEALKLPDKIDMIEITSKDLSPASYCSNLDLLIPDFYKGYNNGSWFNNGYSNSQKIEYSSCAQSTNGPNSQTKYCSIQKTQDYDTYGYSLGQYGGLQSQQQQPGATNQDYYNFYETNKVSVPLQTPYFDIPLENLQGLDQESEESDIIVEESDEDIVDYNEKFPSELSKCIICNAQYTPLGTQFYYLSPKSPLTMSTQKPVYTKVSNILGKITTDVNYLCSECLGLINTIDHLQLKLDNFNMELLQKFQKTCRANNVVYKSQKPRKKYLPERQFKCKICKSVLSMKSACSEHLKQHKFKGFLCELCGKIVRNKRCFLIHQRKHKPKQPPKIESFKCSSCPKYFRTKSSRTEHENYCLGLLPYVCKYCDKRFPSPTKLKNHVKLKHDKKFIAICSICNIGFVKYSDYKSHKISHSTDKKFACLKCDKSYKTLSNLNFHMKVHSGKLPFICHICGKGFMRKEYLEAHVNNHNGVKNFICSICDKKFVSQKNLDCHLKYHDGTTKTKTCNVCGKVMTTGFEEHLRIHNNLREFECDRCDNKFNTKGTLAKHKKRKHSDN